MDNLTQNVHEDTSIQVAIAAAVYLYSQELRDVENTVLTINKMSRMYSPWNSKFHGLNAYYKYRR
jgi:hypothetical protein